MAASSGKDTDYTTFSSESDGTHEYESDGGATARWFIENSNADSLINEIADDHDKRDAIYEWTCGTFMSGQQYDGFSNMDWRDQARTRIYDNILDRARLDQPIVVHRRATAELLFGAGTRVASEEEIKGMIGKTIVQVANMSTGAAKEGLTIGSNKQIDYEIRIPKGKGWGMWIGDKRINPYFGDEQREFMTNRDIELKIVGYEKITGGTGSAHGKAMYKVILQAVRQREHDYS